MKNTDPITTAWLRETAPAGIVWGTGGYCKIPLRRDAYLASRKWSLCLYRLRKGVRPASIHSHVDLGSTGGASAYLNLPTLRNTGDLRNLWRALTGEEWGASPAHTTDEGLVK